MAKLNFSNFLGMEYPSTVGDHTTPINPKAKMLIILLFTLGCVMWGLNEFGFPAIQFVYSLMNILTIL